MSKNESDLFSDAAMTASSERLVRTLGALAYSAKPVVNLFPALVRVSAVGLRSDTLGIAPARGIPDGRLLPYTGVRLANGGARKNVVSSGNDIRVVFRRGREGGRHYDVGSDLAHDAVDGRVHAESFADDRVENGEGTNLLVCHLPQFAVRGTEMLHLLLVEGLAARNSQ